MAYRSRQRVHGGGKFASENQRRAMWANSKSAARKWAHNLSAAHDPSWRGMRKTALHSGGVRSAGGSALRSGGRPRKGGSTATRQRRAPRPSRNRGRKR